jgi:hypothetical protein
VAAVVFSSMAVEALPLILIGGPRRVGSRAGAVRGLNVKRDDWRDVRGVLMRGKRK